MSMSSCPKCWDTPCECGYEYRGWSAKPLAAHIATLQWVQVCQAAEDAGRPVPDDKTGSWARWKAEEQAEQGRQQRDRDALLREASKPYGPQP